MTDDKRKELAKKMADIMWVKPITEQINHCLLMLSAIEPDIEAEYLRGFNEAKERLTATLRKLTDNQVSGLLSAFDEIRAMEPGETGGKR